MRVILGSDHAGYELKSVLVNFLHQRGDDPIDLGTHSEEPVDYPDYAEKVAQEILKGDAAKGILICGSGVGASVTANKFAGIRAGLCHDTYSAHQGVEHDNMNILVMGSRIIGIELAKELVTHFLEAKFSQVARHQRRLDKIKAIESQRGLR